MGCATICAATSSTPHLRVSITPLPSIWPADSLLHRPDHPGVLRHAPLRLVYLYYKHQKNTGNRTRLPASTELPRVTIQLPIFNEQFVIDRLVECVCKIEYPADKLDIQVLDDSTDETVEVARGVVERYAALGHPSLTTTAPIARATRQARWRRA